jgi:hypothetical protein
MYRLTFFLRRLWKLYFGGKMFGLKDPTLARVAKLLRFHTVVMASVNLAISQFTEKQKNKKTLKRK